MEAIGRKSYQDFYPCVKNLTKTKVRSISAMLQKLVDPSSWSGSECARGPCSLTRFRKYTIHCFSGAQLLITVEKHACRMLSSSTCLSLGGEIKTRFLVTLLITVLFYSFNKYIHQAPAVCWALGTEETVMDNTQGIEYWPSRNIVFCILPWSMSLHWKVWPNGWVPSLRSWTDLASKTLLSRCVMLTKPLLLQRDSLSPCILWV